MQRAFIFALMTLSQIKLALLLPLAFGCAHAVYDGQPESSDSNTDEPTVNVAGSASVVTMLPNKETPNLGAAGSATDFG